MNRVTRAGRWILMGAAALSASATSAYADVDNVVAFTPVFSLEVSVRTSNRRNADTDGKVWVTFERSHDREDPVDSWYHLDLPGNDFERSSVGTYHVPPTRWGIERIEDLEHFEVGLGGTDMWCYTEINLIVNGEIGIPVYDGRRRCLDNPSTSNLSATLFQDRDRHTPQIRHRDLFGETDYDRFFHWRDILAGRRPLVMTADEVARRIESAVGKQVSKYSSLKQWLESDIQVERLANDTYRVEFSVLKKSCSYVFPVGGVCSYRRRTMRANLSVRQRNDHLTQTFLEVRFSGGDRLARRRVFHHHGEVHRVKLFAHNHDTVRIDDDGTMRFGF